MNASGLRTQARRPPERLHRTALHQDVYLPVSVRVTKFRLPVSSLWRASLSHHASAASIHGRSCRRATSLRAIFDRFPQCRFRTFLPGARAFLAQQKRPSPTSSTRAPGCAAGRSTFGTSIAMEAAMVAAPKLRTKRTGIANIGVFTKAEDGVFNGVIKTLALNTQGEARPHRRRGQRPRLSDLRLQRRNRSGLKRMSQAEKPYISVKLDDPSLPAPIFCSLHEDDANQHSLIWTRPQPRSDRPSASPMPAGRLLLSSFQPDGVGGRFAANAASRTASHPALRLWPSPVRECRRPERSR